MKVHKKILSFLMTVCMLVTLVPAGLVHAEDSEPQEQPTEVTVEQESDEQEPQAEYSAPVDETTEETVVDEAPAEPNALTNTDFYKIVMIDTGRAYYTPAQIKHIIHMANLYDYDQVMLLFGNDGLRFLLDDMSVTANGTTYDSDTIKNAIKAQNAKLPQNPYSGIAGTKQPQADAGEWSQAEMDEVLAYAQSEGVNIIPGIDVPGHATSIVAAIDSVGIANPGIASRGGSNDAGSATINLVNEQAYNFTVALLKKYFDYFAGKGSTDFNLGMDEYAGNLGGYDDMTADEKTKMSSFLGDLCAALVADNMNPMAFVDQLASLQSNGYSIPESLIGINYHGEFLTSHSNINANQNWYYVIGNNSASGWAAYGTAKTSLVSQNVNSPCTQYKSSNASNQDVINNTRKGSLLAIWDDPYRNPSEYISSIIELMATQSHAAGNANYFHPTAETLTEQTVTVSANGTSQAYVLANQNVETGAIDTEDNTIATANVQNIDAETTYYTIGQKLTGLNQIQSGEKYLIVCNNGANGNGRMLNNTFSPNGSATAGNSVDAAYVWTFTKVDGADNTYTIQTQDGRYLGYTDHDDTHKNVVLMSSASAQTRFTAEYYTNSAVANSFLLGINSFHLNYGGDNGGVTGFKRNNPEQGPNNCWSIYAVSAETRTEPQKNVTFTGVNPGTTWIALGGADFTLNVVAANDDQSVNVTVGNTVTVNLYDSSVANGTYDTADNTIATVSVANGAATFRGLKPGETTVTLGNTTYTIHVFNGQTITMPVGTSQQVYIYDQHVAEGEYATDDTSIATASVSAEETVTQKSSMGEQLTGAIVSGNQYVITSNTTREQRNYEAKGDLSFTGPATQNDFDTWTFDRTEDGKYTIRNEQGQYLSFEGTFNYGHNVTAVLKSDGTEATAFDVEYLRDVSSWQISATVNGKTFYLNFASNTICGYENNATAGPNSRWNLTTVNVIQKQRQTVTFNGITAGTTQVVIGDTLYTIIVEAATLTYYPFISSYPVYPKGYTGSMGHDGDPNAQIIHSSATDVNTENGAALSSIAWAEGTWLYDTNNTSVTTVYWQGMVHTTRNQKQVKGEAATPSSDHSTQGIEFQYIRYYDGKWSVSLDRTTWTDIDTSNDEVCAYYLMKTQTTKEVSSSVKDWAFTPDEYSHYTNESKYPDPGVKALTMGVVYPDGTISTTNGTVTPVNGVNTDGGNYYKSSMIYWADTGIIYDGDTLLMYFDGSEKEYKIHKITYTMGRITSADATPKGTLEWDQNIDVAVNGTYEVDLEGDQRGNISSEGVTASYGRPVTSANGAVRVRAEYNTETGTTHVTFEGLEPGTGVFMINNVQYTVTVSEQGNTYGYYDEKTYWEDGQNVITNQASHPVMRTSDFLTFRPAHVQNDNLKPARNFDYANDAMLILVYVEPEGDTLTVNYFDQSKVLENPNADPFYTYNIGVDSKTTFKRTVGSDHDSWTGYLNDGDVVNDVGVTQRVDANLHRINGLDPVYRNKNFVCVDVRLSEDGKTLNLYYNLSEQSYPYVIDFGKPVSISKDDLIAADASGDINVLQISKVTEQPKYGTAEISADGSSVTYTPKQVLPESDSFMVNLKLGDKDSATNDEETSTVIIRIYPATTVYYEETFADWKDKGFTAQGTQSTSVNQKSTKLGANTDHYGYDDAYKDTTGASDGTWLESTTKGDNMDFTFTGDGIDLYSNNKIDSGRFMVILRDSNNKVKKLVMVQTKTNDAEGYTSNDETYNVPVVSWTGLEHGTYTVSIRNVEVNGTVGTKPVYVDGFKVYNTLPSSNIYADDLEDNPTFTEVRDLTFAGGTISGPTEKKNEDGATTYTYTYTGPDGKSVEVTDLKQLTEQVWKTISSTSTGATTASALIIRTNGVSIDPDYIQNGPKNEIYLKPGDSLTLSIETARKVQLGLSGVQGAAKAHLTVSEPLTTEDKTAESTQDFDLPTTDMFYEVLFPDSDTRVRKGAATITITNPADATNWVAVTKLKVSDDPTAVQNLDKQTVENGLIAALVDPSVFSDQVERLDTIKPIENPVKPVIPVKPVKPVKPLVKEETTTMDTKVKLDNRTVNPISKLNPLPKAQTNEAILTLRLTNADGTTVDQMNLVASGKQNGGVVFTAEQIEAATAVMALKNHTLISPAKRFTDVRLSLGGTISECALIHGGILKAFNPLL